MVGYEEEITIYEYSAFEGRKQLDKVDGDVYCLSCEDGGHIILSEIEEEVFEKIKNLYGELPLKNNPASAFILLLAIADYPDNSSFSVVSLTSVDSAILSLLSVSYLEYKPLL